MHLKINITLLFELYLFLLFRNFGYSYLAGGVPVKMTHGHVNLKLIWDIPREDLNYDPLLIVCFDGLKELAHPYKFIAYQSCLELLEASNARNKVVPLLPKLIKFLREALNSNYESVCLRAVEVTRLLSNLVQENLNAYLKYFIQPINKLSYNL